MERLKIIETFVEEGLLYEVMGEDDIFHTFYAFINARGVDGKLYQHTYAFPGHGTYPDNHPLAGIKHLVHSRSHAEHAARKIFEFGSIDLKHWEIVDETPRDLEADWEAEHEREINERNWNPAYK